MSSEFDDAPGRQRRSVDDSSRLAAFEQYRGLLFSIAYRMLGSVADAEDTIQDAFIRWQRASEADIRSPKAFLVTIVSRLCINQLESARVRREAYVGEWLPEPLVTDPGSNASDILHVDQSVSMALSLGWRWQSARPSATDLRTRQGRPHDRARPQKARVARRSSTNRADQRRARNRELSERAATVGVHSGGEGWAHPGDLHRDQSREAFPFASTSFLI